MSQDRRGTLTMLGQLGSWSASTRFRLLQYAPHLAETFDLLRSLPNDQPPHRGGPADTAVFWADHAARYLRRRRDVIRAVRASDALFVQRGLYPVGPGAVAKPVNNFSGRVVLDLDDNLFSTRPSFTHAGALKRWLYSADQTRVLARRADAIVVSTPAIEDALPPTSAEVVIIPTVPDPARVRQATHSRDNRVVCWAGTSGGLGYLDPLAPVFADIQASDTGRLEVVCSEPWSLGPSDFRRWQPGDDETMFADYAVGIMPLPDTEYTRAKAGFKLLQYMAAGLPVVASPIGVNVELVENSGGGFLASSPDEWRRQLKRLLDDVDLRTELGQRGRAFVESYADIAGHAETLTRLLSPQT